MFFCGWKVLPWMIDFSKVLLTVEGFLSVVEDYTSGRSSISYMI